MVYNEVQAAEVATEQALINPIYHQGRRLNVTAAYESPHRVLHVTGRVRDELDVRALLKEHDSQIEWVRMGTCVKNS